MSPADPHPDLPQAPSPGATGGSPPSSTRSIRAASPTPTATASATSAASSAPRPPRAARRRRRVALARSTASPRPTTATTSATTRTSTRCSARSSELDELIAELHARGHAAGDGPGRQPHQRRAPWFAESRSSKDEPKRDWYWWRPPRGRVRRRAPGGRADQLGLGVLRPGVELRRGTGEYYLHLFAPKQPDLNWENPEVRQAVYAMMRWWLDRGVDGFRMDVICLLSKVLGSVGATAG